MTAAGRSELRLRPSLRLSAFVMVFLPLVTGLGVWQWRKADEALLFEAHIERMAASAAQPLTDAVRRGEDGDLRPVRVEGRFLADVKVWRDNRTHQGRAGYELLVPFADEALGGQRVLVNLGWVPGGVDRSVLPVVALPTSRVELTGRLAPARPPPAVFGDVLERLDAGVRVQRVEIEGLEAELGLRLYPRILVADPGEPGVQTWNFQPARLSSDRHRGYAIQWFGLAVVLVIGWCAASLRRQGQA